MEVEGSHESTSPCPDLATGGKISGCDSEAHAASLTSASMSADPAAQVGDLSHATSLPAAGSASAAAPAPSESLAEIPVPRPRSISDMEMAVLQVGLRPFTTFE